METLSLSQRILRCAGSARDKIEHYELVCCYHEAANLEAELVRLVNTITGIGRDAIGAPRGAGRGL